MSDDVGAKIQTEHILITDLSQSSGDTLICWSTGGVHRTFRWFHQFIGSDELTELPKITENKSSYFGWTSEITHQDAKNKLTLLREMDTVPIEGVFTCSVVGKDLDTADKSEAVSVGIHYPSKITNLRKLSLLTCLGFDDLNQRSLSIYYLNILRSTLVCTYRVLVDELYQI